MGGAARRILSAVATRTLKKWESEDEINASLRALTEEVRQLRAELRGSMDAAAGPAEAHAAPAKAHTTHPVEEDRKLRLVARRDRSR